MSYNEIKPGDHVLLVWYGDRNIPKSLSHTRAVVLEKRKTLLQVQSGAEFGNRLVGRRHIHSVWRDGKWVKVQD